MTTVQKLKERFPKYADNIKCDDFTNNIPFNNKLFDIVIDRASLTHNDTESIRRGLDIVHSKMKSGAGFIGIDWFSTNHSDFYNDDPYDDFTRANINSGQFNGVGKVHFSNKVHLLNLFNEFEVKILEEKQYIKYIPYDDHVFASWNIFAVKK